MYRTWANPNYAWNIMKTKSIYLLLSAHRHKVKDAYIQERITQGPARLIIRWVIHHHSQDQGRHLWGARAKAKGRIAVFVTQNLIVPPSGASLCGLRTLAGAAWWNRYGNTARRVLQISGRLISAPPPGQTWTNWTLLGLAFLSIFPSKTLTQTWSLWRLPFAKEGLFR